MENSADNDADKKQRERQMSQKGVASVKKLVFAGIFLLLVGTTAANVYLLMRKDEEKTSQDGNAYIAPDASDWDDGTVLYESGLIEPGKGFEKITLNQTLAAGTYEAMVHYQGVSMDENQRALNSSDSANCSGAVGYGHCHSGGRRAAV